MQAEIIKNTRIQQDLTQEEFARALCEWLPGISLTKQAISSWERGQHIPDYTFLVSVVIAYADWRHEFAISCLEILRPEVWGLCEEESLNADTEMV